MRPRVLSPPYKPPLPLRNGMASTLYTALRMAPRWQHTIRESEPRYQEQIFTGFNGVPLFGWVAQPPHPQGTIVATYGITGSLADQGVLRALASKAFAQNLAVVVFDWRAHGQSAVLSPTLTSDGLFEGGDCLHIAAQAKTLGCPAPFWFMGYSLGGQLALWALKWAQSETIPGLTLDDIGGAAVVCPNLDSTRSLQYLMRSPLGRYLEKAITRSLKKLVWQLHDLHPGEFDPAAIDRANSIWGFDEELVIGRLGFPSVEAYYQASSPLYFLEQLQKPTLILYAANDPMFDPAIVPDLIQHCHRNPLIDLCLTAHGGHVGYVSGARHQRAIGDPDPWWAWNRSLAWVAQCPQGK